MVSKVFRCPFFDPEGRLQAVSGDFPSLGITLDLHPDLEGMTLPDHPSEQDLLRSADLVRELHREFPFRRPPHRTLAHGMGFLPFVRPMMAGTVPLHLIDAPESGCTVIGAGVGKTLLGEVIQLLAGQDPCHTALSRQMPTMEVDLKCWFRTESVVTLFDHFGGGPAFSKPPMLRLGMEPTWEFRPGRGAKPGVFANRGVYLVTGNNRQTTERVYPHAVSIWLECAKPAHRTFSKRLPAWAKENLRDLVVAHLTLIQGWIAQGRPEFTLREKPGFPEYSRIIGGILQTSGLGDDFLADEIPVSQEQVA